MNTSNDLNEHLLSLPTRSDNLLAAFEEQASNTDEGEDENENEYVKILKIAAPSVIC